MADKFNETIQKSIGEADTCRERYVYAAALFFYHSEANYRLIPYQLKYHGNIGVGRLFGKMLGTRLASSADFSDVDFVIPVPLHWTRKWKRGYNQAEVIASAVAEMIEAPLMTDLIKRRKATRTQTKMTVEEKAVNVADAFSVNMKSVQSLSSASHLLLIDDVFTTGSTLCACFTALRTAFPPSVRISVATLAFVGRA